jgi:hypothetical protein
MSSSNSSVITSIIPIENSLAKKQKIATIIKVVVTKVNELENLPSLKGDLELLKYVVSLVINLVKPKYRLSLDEIESIILTSLIQIFSLNPNEIAEVKNAIQFLKDNKLIKKFSTIERGTFSTIQYLKKKFL